jgi:hypothetical protein
MRCRKQRKGFHIWDDSRTRKGLETPPTPTDQTCLASQLLRIMRRAWLRIHSSPRRSPSSLVQPAFPSLDDLKSPYRQEKSRCVKQALSNERGSKFATHRDLKFQANPTLGFVQLPVRPAASLYGNRLPVFSHPPEQGS